jgi:hypothetical protein
MWILVQPTGKWVKFAPYHQRHGGRMSNWKTTLIGIVTGAAYLFLQGLSQGLKPKDAAIGVGLGLLGAFAKDHNQ